MASLLKRVKRNLKKTTGGLIRRAAASRSPLVRERIAPALSYLDAIIVDYGFTRAVYGNRHRVGADVWRSGQPGPRQIGWFAKRGVKTIINLRGDQTPGVRWLQEQACARHGVRLVDFKLRSRAAPTRDELFAMRDLLSNVEYPILLHCKSGADRAGLMSVIVRHERDAAPISEARRQLSLRFGHIRQADTGILDAVFDRYVEDDARERIEFWDWVATKYDSSEIERSFKTRAWANRLVNGVLRRE